MTPLAQIGERKKEIEIAQRQYKNHIYHSMNIDQLFPRISLFFYDRCNSNGNLFYMGNAPTRICLHFHDLVTR